MGQLKRQLLFWGAIATTTAVLPGLALADNVSPDHGGGRHGRGDHGRENRDGDAKLAVAGRAFSKGTTDSYGLQIRGRSGDQPTDAGGMIRFGHKGADGMEGLVGEITCLSKDSAGIVSVTGTIVRSGKRDGKGDKDKDKKAPEMPGAPVLPRCPLRPPPMTTASPSSTSWRRGTPTRRPSAAEPVRKGRDGKGERGRNGQGRAGSARAAANWPARTSPSPSTCPASRRSSPSRPSATRGRWRPAAAAATPSRSPGAGSAPGRPATTKAKDDGKREGRKGRRGWRRARARD